jgi:glutamate-1-semialdehyde 2,1-aminomutase
VDPTPRDDRHQAALLAKAGRLVPGATLDELILPSAVALVPDRGEGSRLWDVDGREYVDYTLGGGALILGHAAPDVVRAATEQAARGSAFALLTAPLVELATRVVGAAPCAERIVFTATGAEATYVALRLARAATGRPAVLKFEGGYHGLHDLGMLSVTSATGGPEPAVEVAGASPGVVAETVVAPFNDLDRTAALLDTHRDRLAAVIVEPYQRVLAPRPGFLEMLRERTRAHGIVLVFDEIVTGFRFAWGGAQALTGVTPDLATYGKVLGGGYPLAAVAGRRDILDRANPRSGDAAFSGSQHGNAVAAAAGLATLGRLAEPGVFERLQEVATLMRSTLTAALAEAGMPGRVVVLGPVWHLLPRSGATESIPGSVEDGPFTEHVASLPGDPAGAAALVTRLSVELTRLGVLAFPRPRRGYVRGYLSLAHADEDVRLTGRRVAEALARSRSTRAD